MISLNITMLFDLPQLIYFVSNGRPEWDSYNINTLLDWLAENGYTHTYIELNQGHSWGNWRDLMDDMLRYFFAT